MHSSGADSIRLVIQRVSGVLPGSVSYRMIAYPERNGLRFRPAHFSNRAAVLSQMKAAIEGFDEKLLRGEHEATQVVFAASLDLTDQQLIRLGVAEAAKGCTH
jgi:hypothetical protein